MNLEEAKIDLEPFRIWLRKVIPNPFRSQKALATKLEISESYLSDFKTGRRSIDPLLFRAHLEGPTLESFNQMWARIESKSDPTRDISQEPLPERSDVPNQQPAKQPPIDRIDGLKSDMESLRAHRNLNRAIEFQGHVNSVHHYSILNLVETTNTLFESVQAVERLNLELSKPQAPELSNLEKLNIAQELKYERDRLGLCLESDLKSRQWLERFETEVLRPTEDLAKTILLEAGIEPSKATIPTERAVDNHQLKHLTQLLLSHGPKSLDLERAASLASTYLLNQRQSGLGLANVT
jgi:transcriptional regulator with XRE-family HTH domain